MLYGYPAAAVRENWLHEALCEAVRAIHRKLDAGRPIPEWPHLLPKKYRPLLEGRTGLDARLTNYIAAVRSLARSERARILRAMIDQNKVGELVACSVDCEGLVDLAEPVQGPAGDLFRFAFELLTPLGLRDRHYACIYENSKNHMCPFCGCEYFDAPGAPREALDHFLPFNKYPFAGANLRNLVPMGNKCNSRYKLAQDILETDDGSRRRSFDPYSEVPRITMSLDDSVPFAGVDDELPRWAIQFDNDSQEVETWLTVFCIRERYARDVLDEGYKTWLQEFATWCRSSPLRDLEKTTILAAVEQYAGYLEALGLNDRAFLKTAMFRMVHKLCREGNARLLALVRELVSGANLAGNT